jgi:hypothetical protein
VLFGSQADAFTARNDLTDFAGLTAGKHDDLAARDFIEPVAHAERPIVAAVSGLAVGIGTMMLLHCDLLYVAETAKLTVPFVNLALAPEVASSMLLPVRIGRVRAFAMFALGEALSGPDVWALGLANKVLPKDELVPAAPQSGQDSGNAAARCKHRDQEIDARSGGNNDSHRPGGRDLRRAPADRLGARGVQGVCRTPPARFHEAGVTADAQPFELRSDETLPRDAGTPTNHRKPTLRSTE